MKNTGIFLFLLVAASLVAAGCTNLSGAAVTATPAPAVATPVPAGTPAPDPTVSGTTIPVPSATGTPEPAVTLVHFVSLTKGIKDSQRLFSLQIPVEWRDIETYRIENPENYEGFMYETDLRPNATFSLLTFSNYRSREQNFRDDCKGWVPAPNATVVDINGLTFDRYESASGGVTNVTYVMRQSGMNDYGFLSVFSFSADTSGNRFMVEDYDRVVQSFRYYPKEKVSTMPGEEISFVYPDDTSGNMRSAFNSGSSSPKGVSTSKCALQRAAAAAAGN